MRTAQGSVPGAQGSRLDGEDTAQGSGLRAQAGPDNRAAADVGRRARLELRFVARGGKTTLADAYAEPPFRVGRAFAEADGLHMIMASSAPGIFGGDYLEQTIHVEPGARVRLTSQSALQAHASRGGQTATLRSRYIVNEGAALSCFWDPLIPFPHARLDQRVEIEIGNGSRLSWNDGFMAGREARGERWRFASLAHQLRVVRNGTLAYLERFRLEPDAAALANTWLASKCCYFGSAIVSADEADAELAERAHNRIASFHRVHGAVDCTEPHLLLIRLMAEEGPPFHAARRGLLEGLRGKP
jgi:urease accessory protein